MVRAMYGPGEAVYSPKDPIGRTFTVESGVIDVLSVDGGDDALIATYYRGSSFGYPDGIDHSRLPAVARARVESVVTICEPPRERAAAPPAKPAPNRNSKARDFLKRDVYYPGDRLFSEGDSGDTAFIIESGEVEIFRTEQGKEIRLGMIGPGALVGEMALIDDEPRMATARAASQAVAVTLSRAAFEKRVSAADPFIRKLLRILVRYIRLHAEYFVKARSDLDDTYLVLGLDPENPDIDRLHEISWQAEKAIQESETSGPDTDNHDDPPRQTPPTGGPRTKPVANRQPASAISRAK